MNLCLVYIQGQSPVDGFISSSKSKYNTRGFSNDALFSNLNVHEKYTGILCGATNLALAENTKSQYRTAIKRIKRIESDLGKDMSLPFTVGKTLNYVGYLLEDRKCSSKTAAQYLSGVRMLHLCNGMDVASLRPPVVNLILKGREHWENVHNTLQCKPKRVPVTIQIMKFLKRVISDSNWKGEKKLRHLAHLLLTVERQSQNT